MRKPTTWVLTRSDINQAVQSQKMVRGWIFWIYKVEKLYYPNCENKGADQFRTCEAVLHLCFRLRRLLVFPCSDPNVSVIHKQQRTNIIVLWKNPLSVLWTSGEISFFFSMMCISAKRIAPDGIAVRLVVKITFLNLTTLHKHKGKTFEHLQANSRKSFYLENFTESTYWPSAFGRRS